MKRLFLFIFSLFVCFSANAKIQELPEKIIFPKDHGNHLQQAMDVWIFTGEVETEEGNKYAYMYQLKRKNDQLIVFANIIDLASQKEVLYYKDKTKLQVSSSRDQMQWKVGKAFMKYNLISDSWLFGILDEKNGFNFRLKGVRSYVLNGQNGYLSKGEKLFKASYSAQSMNINGHLTLKGKSNFVTGKNSWFEHHWGMLLSRHNTVKYALITCRYNDNTGLMLYEWFGSKNFWPGHLKTGTYQDASDKSRVVTNFSLVKLNNTNKSNKSKNIHQWVISVPALNIHISAEGDMIPEYDVIYTKNNKDGYCFVNEKGF